MEYSKHAPKSVRQESPSFTTATNTSDNIPISHSRAQLIADPEHTPSNTEEFAQVPEPQYLPALALDSTVPDMDEFAQTRPPDDLFSDDFEPIPDPAVEESLPSGPIPEIEPIAIRKIQPNPQPQQSDRSGSSASNGARSSRKSSNHIQPKAQMSQQQTQTTDGKPTVATDAAPQKVEAVRGDRSGTGGPKRTKLTEEELNARMEAMKLKNASLEAAHAKAEADETTFNAREAEELERRKRDRQNRLQMMGEREKNRQRKLQALGGREWDAEKPEQVRQYGNEERKGRSQYSRGAHGGVAPVQRVDAHAELAEDDAAATYEWHDNPGRGARGRGGRGGRSQRGGRGGRGGRGRGTGLEIDTQPQPNKTVPVESDFPALPRSEKTSVVDGKPPAAIKTNSPAIPKLAATQTAESSLKPESQAFNSTAKFSWADEMGSPVVSTGV